MRDDEPVGPKPPGERRVLLIGDSLVMSVQVPLATTFGEQLERLLNEGEADPGVRWRVINGGVQGYGPVQDWLFFDHVTAAFEPDVVLIVVFAGNDALEAYDMRGWLDGGRPSGGAEPALGVARRVVRSSVVLQLVRLRWDQLRSRLATEAPERPLAAYLADPPPEVALGVDVARDAFGRIAARASAMGARTGFVLMPARFEVDDADYGRLSAGVTAAGGVLERHAAGERLREGLAPLGLPWLDLLPVLSREPDRSGLFFQRNVHLTPRGHLVVARALDTFVRVSGLAPPAGASR